MTILNSIKILLAGNFLAHLILHDTIIYEIKTQNMLHNNKQNVNNNKQGWTELWQGKPKQQLVWFDQVLLDFFYWVGELVGGDYS